MDDWVQEWTELYGVDQHPDETDDELRARILRAIQSRGPSPGSVEHCQELHAEVKRQMPVGVLFGPFMVRGYSHRFSDLLTRIAFWLLRKARWELVSSEWD
jgi:hypothetical protein